MGKQAPLPPRKKNGKAMGCGTRERKRVEVKRRKERGKLLLLSRKVIGCYKAHRVTFPLTAIGSMFGN